MCLSFLFIVLVHCFHTMFALMQGVNDPQTEADRRAQRCIVSSLKYQYPQVTVVAEEVIYKFLCMLNTSACLLQL